MQRIDENTYIDDTLVTCAEYQLFIDKMREQGQRYQPDHWTSYQFPMGQAREPVLGVRSSDAEAFCKWLTESQGKEWKFRLPIQKETDAFPLKSIGINPLGYWITDTKYPFAWVGTVPKGTYVLELANSFSYTRKFSTPRLIALATAIAHNINLDRNLNLLRDFNNARKLAHELNSELDNANELILPIDIEITTLQERIAGRSPAFEGIRLVKERIR